MDTFSRIDEIQKRYNALTGIDRCRRRGCEPAEGWTASGIPMEFWNKNLVKRIKTKCINCSSEIPAYIKKSNNLID